MVVAVKHEKKYRHLKDLNCLYKIKRSCQMQRPHNWPMSFRFMSIYWPIFFRILKWFSVTIHIFCIFHHCGVHNSNVQRGTRWQRWICIFTIIVKILGLKTFFSEMINVCSLIVSDLYYSYRCKHLITNYIFFGTACECKAISQDFCDKQ